MRQQHEEDFRNPEQDTIPGVIDTIGLGYARLLEHPYVITIPVLIDVYLWLGVKMRAEPFTAHAAQWIAGLSGAGDSVARFLESWNGLNVFELASFRLPTVRLPTVLPLVSDDSTLSLSSLSPDLTALPWWSVLLIGVTALAASFLIGAEYLCRLSAATAGTTHQFSVRRLVAVSRSLVAWILILTGAFLLVTGPLIVAQIAFALVGIGTSGIITFLMTLPAALGFVVFFFSVYAIVVDRLGAMESLRASYQVVRRYLWQSAGLIAAYFLVVNAFPLVWQRLLVAPAGTLIAIIGHAFIASGMIAAAMIFYRDRARNTSLTDVSIREVT